jgi:hypothetical protein
MTGEVLYATVAQGIDQRLGNAAQAEAADRQQLAVGHDALEGRGGGRIELVHTGLLEIGKA